MTLIRIVPRVYLYTYFLKRALHLLMHLYVYTVYLVVNVFRKAGAIRGAVFAGMEWEGPPPS